MVKTLCSVLISSFLLIGSLIFENFFIHSQFQSFQTSVTQLQKKVETHQVNPEEIEEIKSVWDYKKNLLHIVIPHNDIGWIDYWLSETEGCILSENFTDAYSKLQIIISVCDQLPAQYTFSFGNIF